MIVKKSLLKTQSKSCTNHTFNGLIISINKIVEKNFWEEIWTDFQI